MEKEKLNELGYIIIGAAYDVRSELGAHMLESLYEEALEYELQLRGIACRRQVPIKCLYKGKELGNGFRADLLVENEIVVELKAHQYVIPDNFRQLSTYMNIAGFKLGYLINFGAADFRIAKHSEQNDYTLGIYRLVNGL